MAGKVTSTQHRLHRHIPIPNTAPQNFNDIHFNVRSDEALRFQSISNLKKFIKTYSSTFLYPVDTNLVNASAASHQASNPHTINVKMVAPRSTSSPKSHDALTDSFKFGSSMFESPADRQSTYHAYLFGYPIAHSLSPLLHTTLFKRGQVPWKFSLAESKNKSDMIPKLRDPSCIGCAVTMPHKIDFISEIDALTDEGKTIGAINTIFKRKDENGQIKYIGTNTDCIGIREAFLQNCPDVLSLSSGRPALVIGGGGTCRSSVYALWKWMGASDIYIVGRIKEEVSSVIAVFESNPEFTSRLIHVETVEQAQSLEAPALIVNAVPDFPPKSPGELLASNIITNFLGRNEETQNRGIALEMCYHPEPITAFFVRAEAQNWKVISGIEAMIYQGIAQQVLWLERPSSNTNVKYAEQVVRGVMQQVPAKL